MSSAQRRRAVLLAASLALLASLVWLLRDSPSDLANLVAEPAARAESHAERTRASVNAPDAQAQLELGSPNAAEPSQRDEAPIVAERFDFELQVLVLDTWDLPVEGVAVLAGPTGLALSEIGSTGRDGRLTFAFRAFAAEVELDLALGGPFGVIERVSLSAGRSEVTRRVESPAAAQAAILAQRLGAAAEGAHSVRVTGRGIASELDTFRVRAVTAADGRAVFCWGGDPARKRSVAWRRVLESSGESISIGASARTNAGTTGRESVRVRVRDASGASVAGASVAVLAAWNQQLHVACTDSAGELAFEQLGSGEHPLAAWRADLGRARASVAAQASGEPVELVLSREGLRRAVLVDARGLALESRHVWVEERSSGRSIQALGVTDEHGKFEFVAPLAAPVRVCVAPNRPAALPIVIATELTLSGSDFTFVAPFDSQGARAQARVRILPSDTHERASFEVWLRDVDGGFAIEIDIDRSVDSDNFSEQFLASDLDAGRYEFELRCEGLATVRSGRFVLRSGEDFDAGLLELAPRSRLRIEPRSPARPSVRSGRLLVRRGDFELASQRLDLAQETELWLEPGVYRFGSADLLESFGDLTLPSNASVRLRPDGVVERIGP